MLKKLMRTIRSLFERHPILGPPHPSTARTMRPYDLTTWPERMAKYPFAYR
jgi:hypothetical protein